MSVKKLQADTPLFWEVFKAVYGQRTMEEHAKACRAGMGLKCHECGKARAPSDASLECPGPRPDHNDRTHGCGNHYAAECCLAHAKAHLLAHLEYELDAKWYLKRLTKAEGKRWRELHGHCSPLPNWYRGLVIDGTTDAESELAVTLYEAIEEIEGNAE